MVRMEGLLILNRHRQNSMPSVETRLRMSLSVLADGLGFHSSGADVNKGKSFFWPGPIEWWKVP